MLWGKLCLVFEEKKTFQVHQRAGVVTGLLLDSKHRLQILQKLRIMLMLLTTCCPTTWN